LEGVEQPCRVDILHLVSLANITLPDVFADVHLHFRPIEFLLYL
jgi:hypothetical protein